VDSTKYRAMQKSLTLRSRVPALTSNDLWAAQRS